MRQVQEGDYFLINIPGRGLLSGGGYDCVQVVKITESKKSGKDETGITVKPVSNPKNSDPDTAHFFTDDASSTFIVRREGNTIYAEVHGRNERANTNSENIIDKARNLIVATGAMLGLSEVQWKSLTKVLLNNNIEE